MSDTTDVLTVNTKKDYHNCEMIFSMYYENPDNGFKVDEEQQYRIFTTIKEVDALNEALNLFQSKGFKDNFLLYTSVVDGSAYYPEFVIDYIDAIELGKELQILANDEDSLVQLSEYCLETPPTYEDDFKINKKIESITIDGDTKTISDYDDLEAYISTLRDEKPELFA